jgi:hypothetical protein
MSTSSSIVWSALKLRPQGSWMLVIAISGGTRYV